MLEDVSTNALWLTAAIGLPLLAALIVWGLGAGRFAAARLMGLGASAIPFAILLLAAFRMAPEAGFQLTDRFAWWPEVGLSLSLAVDGLGLAFALLAAGLGTLGVASARRSSELGFALLAQAAALVIFTAQDLVLLALGYWVLPMALYALIAGWGQARAEYASTKFLVMALLGASLLTVSLMAIALVGEGAALASLWARKPGFPVVFLNHWVLAGLMLMAWMTAPLFPFHTWLSDVYRAAPPSALPLVVGGVQAGAIYVVLRLALGLFPSYAQAWLPALGGLGVATLLYALLVSWGQKSLLRGLSSMGVALAGLTLAGIAMVKGPEAAQALTRAIAVACATTGVMGLLAWSAAELHLRTGGGEEWPTKLGFLAPGGTRAFVGFGALGLVLVVLTGCLLVPVALEAGRLPLALGLGLGLLALSLTGGLALRGILTNPATPARPDGIQDLTARDLAVPGALAVLLAGTLVWLFLGNRAIVAFASQLSLGFGQ